MIWNGAEVPTVGRAAATDVIEASGLAYVNSLNRYEAMQKKAKGKARTKKSSAKKTTKTAKKNKKK